MSLEAPPIDRPRKRRRFRSWFQFSLRTFLILTILVGGILSQAASEFATARNRERAVARLADGGYIVHCGESRQPRWVTSIIPDQQWRRWFRYGSQEGIDLIWPAQDTPKEILSTREIFRQLNAFESCKRVYLRYRPSAQETISATDLLSFDGWKDIEDVDLSGALPDESAFRLLATSANLKEFGLRDLVNVPRARLVDFLSTSEIESLELVRLSFVGESPWLCSDSLKRLDLSTTNLSWEEIGEMLANSHVESLSSRSKLARNGEETWNSKSLRSLKLTVGFQDLDLLGELPALESLEFSVHDGEASPTPLGRLSRYSQLAELTYHGSANLGVMQGIGAIKSLRSLKLGECDGSLEPIAPLKNLESFDAKMTLTRNDVGVLRGLPKLKEVSLKWDQSLEVILLLLDAPSLRKLSLLVDTTPDSSWDAFHQLARDRGIVVDIEVEFICDG